MEAGRPLKRLYEALRRLWRREPGMIGLPPSARQVPADPGLHALDFAGRYAEPMQFHVENRMMELGIPPSRIGCPDPNQGGRWAAFHPSGRQGGNIRPEGNLTTDSGLFNSELLANDYGEEDAKLFWRSRLRDRMDAIIAHEYEEHRHGMSHVEALRHAPLTELPISERAREICRAMERGWRGR